MHEVDWIREYWNILEYIRHIWWDRIRYKKVKKVPSANQFRLAGKNPHVQHATGPTGNHHFEQTIERLGATCVAGKTSLFWGSWFMWFRVPNLLQWLFSLTGYPRILCVIRLESQANFFTLCVRYSYINMEIHQLLRHSERLPTPNPSCT